MATFVTCAGNIHLTIISISFNKTLIAITDTTRWACIRILKGLCKSNQKLQKAIEILLGPMLRDKKKMGETIT